MELIWILEIISLILGIILFSLEVVILKCKNFVPSVFLLLYVPLFSITPLIYHFITNGALSINKKVEGVVFSEPKIYVIYHLYNITLLICFLFSSIFFNKYRRESHQTSSHSSTSQQRFVYFLVLLMGVYLYVSSTGLSIFELLVADRFTWFNNPGYSPFFSVVASYFIALSPLLFFIYYRYRKYFYLFLTVILLIIYGILSKDRKWIIFMISGAIAAKYYFNGNRFVFNAKIVLGSLFIGLILVFWQIFRDVLFTELLTGRGDFVSHAKEMGEKLLMQGDLPYYYFSSMTAIKMNLIDGFNIPLGIIRRQVFFMIPVDFSLGLKIKDISAIFSDALDAGDDIRGGNMPPGLIGLFVLSFNWLIGLFFYALIPIFLFYINIISKLYISNLQPVIYSNCFSFMILLLRGDDSSAFYFFIFNFAIFLLAKKLMSKKIIFRKQNYLE
jgi:hypothetical protein